ncbi:PKD domain-containing protein [bacterium]|nr:MAG: PKD domain-containing protein [bacterium]
MDQMTSRTKEFLWDTPAMFVDFMWGVLRWPFIAISDYKYNRDPKYKERVDKLDEEKEALEKSRVNSLREKLDAYINEDLAKESLKQGQALPAAPKIEPPAAESKPAVALPESKPPVPETQPSLSPKPQPVSPQPQPAEVKPPGAEEKPAAKPSLESPVAVIIAKPAKGYSPLKVNFSGEKSRSKSGRIVSYNWDFGDGDTSTKKNPENTYWSTTYGVRNFTATLTVRDEAGNTSSVSTVIEVATR